MYEINNAHINDLNNICKSTHAGVAKSDETNYIKKKITFKHKAFVVCVCILIYN